MTDPDAALAMDAARMRLNHIRGYLRAVLWAVRTVPAEGIGTMAMSKDAVVYYDPEEVPRLSLEARVTMLYHELGHWMRRHYDRMAAFEDFERAQMAAELELQGDLEGEVTRDRDLEWPPQGYIAPGKPPFEDMPRGKLAEEYYRLLEQQGPMPAQGSVSDGRWKDWEQPDHPEGIGEAQGRLIARKLAQDIQEAAEREDAVRKKGFAGIGSVPAWMRRWADLQLFSKVPWHKVLDAWVRQAIGHVLGYSDYSFRVPNRRAALGGLILPGLVNPVPRIAVVLDTSGSMSNRQVGMALAEIGGVLKAMGMMEGVWVLATDAEAHTCQRVFNPRRVELVGGGGTILESGIARAMKLRPRPEVIIVISDCHNYWEDAKPARTRIVMVRVGTGKAPAWADKVIDVDDGGEREAAWAR